MEIEKISVGKRGIVFGLDGIVACSILLFSLFVIFTSLAAHVHAARANAQDAEKLLFAAAIGEAIVKNRDGQNPSRGAAYFNTSKNRVEVNVLDEALLGKMGKRNFGEFTLSAIYERDNLGKRYFFNEEISDEECAAVERFVQIKGEQERRAVVGVVVCGK